MAVSGPTVRQRLRASHVFAVLAALAVVGIARTGALATAVAVGGCLALVAGLVTHRRAGVVLGGLGLFAASVLVAVASGSVLTVMVGAFGAVLAADFGEFALGLDRDVDHTVATTRVELLHAVGSGAVALVTAGIGYALFLSVPTGSGVGVVALLFAAVVLVAALRVR